MLTVTVLIFASQPINKVSRMNVRVLSRIEQLKYVLWNHHVCSVHFVLGSIERGEGLDAFVEFVRNKVLRAFLDVGGADCELVEQIDHGAEASFEFGPDGFCWVCWSRG